MTGQAAIMPPDTSVQKLEASALDTTTDQPVTTNAVENTTAAGESGPSTPQAAESLGVGGGPARRVHNDTPYSRGRKGRGTIQARVIRRWSSRFGKEGKGTQENPARTLYSKVFPSGYHRQEFGTRDEDDDDPSGGDNDATTMARRHHILNLEHCDHDHDHDCSSSAKKKGLIRRVTNNFVGKAKGKKLDAKVRNRLLDLFASATENGKVRRQLKADTDSRKSADTS